MTAWTPPRRSKKALALSEIIAQEMEDAADEELQRALKASSEEYTRGAADISGIEAEVRATLDDDDASLALALQLEEEGAAAAARSDARRRAAVRKAEARHERVRVLSPAEALLEGSQEVAESAYVVGDGDGISDVIDAEGVVLEAKLGTGLIGRRLDGSLVSKHDARLDARLKAQSLHDTFEGAGDLVEERVPGRVYNDLLRKKDRALHHLQEAAAQRKQRDRGDDKHRGDDKRP